MLDFMKAALVVLRYTNAANEPLCLEIEEGLRTIEGQNSIESIDIAYARVMEVLNNQNKQK